MCERGGKEASDSTFPPPHYTCLHNSECTLPHTPPPTPATLAGVSRCPVPKQTCTLQPIWLLELSLYLSCSLLRPCCRELKSWAEKEKSLCIRHWVSLSLTYYICLRFLEFYIWTHTLCLCLCLCVFVRVCGGQRPTVGIAPPYCLKTISYWGLELAS